MPPMVATRILSYLRRLAYAYFHSSANPSIACLGSVLRLQHGIATDIICSRAFILAMVAKLSEILIPGELQLLPMLTVASESGSKSKLFQREGRRAHK